MHTTEITDAQRREIHFALLERRDELEDIVKKSKKANAPNTTAEKLLKMYGDDEEIDREKGKRKWIPGLLAKFAPDPELADTPSSKGPQRDADGQQDAFGGGVEVGGGKAPADPDLPIAFLDRYGNAHDTEAERDAANLQPDPAIDHGSTAADGGVGAEPVPESEREPGTPFRRLGAGDEPDTLAEMDAKRSASFDPGHPDGDRSVEIEADYEIVDDGTGNVGTPDGLETAPVEGQDGWTAKPGDLRIVE